MSYRAKLRLGLLSATMFTGTALAAPALADDNTASAAATATADDTSASAPDDTTPTTAPAAQGDAIVVTATRRATSILNTPINISAVSSQQIEQQRIDDVRGLGDFTPGLTIVDTGPRSTGTIVLRGLSASDTDTYGDSSNSAMGIYLGEVPLYYDFKLLDLERVETLLGPQGTLYGLGTLAGAIRYIPNRPNVDEFEGEAHSRVFGEDHSGQIGYQVDGVINIPIVRDHVAFRTSTGYYFNPGFIDDTMLVQQPGVSLPQPSGTQGVTPEAYAANLYTKKDVNFERTFTTRNQLLFETTDDFKVIFTYAYQQTKTDGGQFNSAGVLGTGKYDSAVRYTEPVNRHAHLASMEINANLFDFADLVSTTAYTEVYTHSKGDNTDLLLDLDYDYELFPAFTSWNESTSKRKQIDQEVRLVSRHGGPFNWVLGGFYNQQKVHRDYAEHVPGYPGVAGGTLPNPEELEYVSYTDSKVTEKAVFGEGTFHVTPQWQVTAGARYFKYTSSIEGIQTLPLLGGPISPYDKTPAGGTAGKSGWVWKLNTSYNFTPDVMVYATYSKGYRIGGPNTVAPCDNPLPPGQNICALPDELQYGPDTTKNIEIGTRMQLFDRALTFNFDVFHINWDGIQVASSTVNGAVGITVNGGAAVSKGFETSFQVKPVKGLTIQGTYAYTDAHLTEDVPGILTIREVPNDYDYRFVQLDAHAGDRLPGSTKHSGSLGATYTMPFMGGDLSANWTATYHGNVVTRLGWDRAYGEKLPAYVLHRASLTYETDKYSLTLFANNIFDKYAVTSIDNDLSRVGINDGVVVRFYHQGVLTPRTFGLEGRVKF